MNIYVQATLSVFKAIGLFIFKASAVIATIWGVIWLFNRYFLILSGLVIAICIVIAVVVKADRLDCQRKVKGKVDENE